MNQAERVVKILEILSMGRRITINSLADIFDGEVSKRALQRDMQTIEYAGIPLEYETGENGAYIWYFPREYKNMVPPSVQSNELIAAYMLKSYLKTFKGTSIEHDLDSVIDKLEKIAPGDVYDMLTDSGELLWNQDFGDFDYGKFNEILEKSLSAALNKQWYEIIYQSGGKERKHIIFVHKLFTYNGVIYLAANEAGRDDYVTLTLQHIVRISRAERQLPPSAPFDLAKFRENRFAVFAGSIHKVKLHINKETVKYFVNRRWHPTQKLYKEADGSLILEMETPLSWELIGLILNWHTQIKVLEPPELIEKVKERLRETLRTYE
jgi:proteasome accessory factor B